jgi:hypothetical protein
VEGKRGRHAREPESGERGVTKRVCVTPGLAGDDVDVGQKSARGAPTITTPSPSCADRITCKRGAVTLPRMP